MFVLPKDNVGQCKQRVTTAASNTRHNESLLVKVHGLVSQEEIYSTYSKHTVQDEHREWSHPYGFVSCPWNDCLILLLRFYEVE